MARRKFAPELVTDRASPDTVPVRELPAPPFSGKPPKTCSMEWIARYALCRSMAESLVPQIREADFLTLQGLKDEFESVKDSSFYAHGEWAETRDELKIRSYNSNLSSFIDEEFRYRYKSLKGLMDSEVIDLANRLKNLPHNEGGIEASARLLLQYAGLSHLLVLQRELNADFKTAVAPDTAPEIFRERASKSENAPTFVGRVYGQWLTGEFTRADLRRLDESAYIGLKNWERLHGKSDLNLPTIIEQNDRKTKHFEVTPEVREYRRLQSARQRRLKNL